MMKCVVSDSDYSYRTGEVTAGPLEEVMTRFYRYLFCTMQISLSQAVHSAKGIAVRI